MMDREEAKTELQDLTKAIEELENRFPIKNPANTKTITALKMAIKALEQKPKTGRWIEERTYMECQNCNDIWHYQQNQTHRFKFCPTCGAKMEDAKESDKRVVDCKSLPCAHRRYGLLLPGSPQKCVDCLKEMYGIEEVEE